MSLPTEIMTVTFPKFFSNMERVVRARPQSYMWVGTDTTYPFYIYTKADSRMLKQWTNTVHKDANDSCKHYNRCIRYFKLKRRIRQIGKVMVWYNKMVEKYYSPENAGYYKSRDHWNSIAGSNIV